MPKPKKMSFAFLEEYCRDYKENATLAKVFKKISSGKRTNDALDLFPNGNSERLAAYDVETKTRRLRGGFCVDVWRDQNRRFDYTLKNFPLFQKLHRNHQIRQAPTT